MQEKKGNWRYRSGRNQEYRVGSYLRSLGYIVIRSAGSHGNYDLVAIHPEQKVIRLLQLKYGSKAYLKHHDAKKVGIEGQYMLTEEIIEITPFESLSELL